jgi:hypothetical protein
MKVIKVKIEALNMDYDEMEKYEEMGMPLKNFPTEMIDLYVNTDNIVAFNNGTDGTTTLYTTGREVPFMIHMEFNEFLDLLGL